MLLVPIRVYGLCFVLDFAFDVIGEEFKTKEHLIPPKIQQVQFEFDLPKQPPQSYKSKETYNSVGFEFRGHDGLKTDKQNDESATEVSGHFCN